MSFVIFWAFGIPGEPALLYPLALSKQLADGPEGGGAENADDGRQDGVLDEQGADNTGDADKEENDPGTSAPVVLGLDDDGMPYPDGQKGAEGNDESCEIHNGLVGFAIFVFVLVVEHGEVALVTTLGDVVVFDGLGDVGEGIRAVRLSPDITSENSLKRR